MTIQVARARPAALLRLICVLLLLAPVAVGVSTNQCQSGATLRELKMIDENAAMLESDRLDDLLEAPVQAPPVVVVEYRDRGAPSKTFFLVLFLVPLVAILVYHRTVVEQYRVQVARANAAPCARPVAQRLASATAVVETGVPGPAVAVARDSVLPEVKTPPTSALPSAVAARAGEDTKPAETAAPAEAAPRIVAAAGEPAPVKEAPAPVEAASPAVVSEPPAAALPPPSSVAITGELPVEQAKMPKITTRSVLPNPFADGTEAPKPPVPGALQPPAENEKTAAKPQEAMPAQTAAVAPASGGSGAAANALAPLPTKEETLQQIQQEAAHAKPTWPRRSTRKT